MADAMLSAAAGRIVALIEEQARYHVNLVKGAKKEVLSLGGKLKSIRNVLDDAENRRFKDKNINYWMSRLEATSYEMEDVLDEWDYALLKLKMEGVDLDDADVAQAPKQKVCSFVPSFSCFKKTAVRHHIAKKILNVKEQLDEIFKEKDQFGFLISHPTTDPLLEYRRDQSSSFSDLAKVHGRDEDRDILVSKLIDIDDSQEELGIRVVSIVGVGGLGKTTLAQLVYNHSPVEEYFKLRIWICVSDPFDLVVVAKGILDSIKKGSSPNTDQLDVLLKHVKESVSGKKFLLVLDDVWTEDYNKWEPLESCLGSGEAGSKILVTTRSERVAKKMGTRESEIFNLGLLSEEDCWLFLCRMALSGRNKVGFEDIGKKIAKKCNGLPLAAKTLGSVLRFKSSLEEWENVLNSEVWKMEEAEVDIFPHLLLSYNELSPTLKHCFSYCAVFPKDSEIVVETLIEKWMALGYLGSNIDDMELKGQECFDVLATRSLFQDFEKDDLDEIKSVKMHDIVHDFAQFIRKKGREEAAGMNKTTCQVCNPSLAPSVSEFKSLIPILRLPPNLCNCLIRLRVLNMLGVPHGMKNLIHLRWLNLFGMDKLTNEELKIIFQLYSLQTLRLWGCNSEEIPREIGNLIHLRSLGLSGNNSLKVLPKEIGTLIQLRRLDLSGNKSLEELPSEIGNLIHLRHLNLSGNESLRELPKEIGNLIDLRFLDLSENGSLTELPKEIGNLIHLRHFDLRGVESLNELPNQIGNLFHLRRLDLSENKSLKELPKEIGKLVHLSYLNLGGNELLEELPKEIGNLIHLKHLNLQSNSSLEELPKEIGNLIQLTHLDLSGIESLKKLPSEIGNLIHLTHLDLQNNSSLEELPKEIGNLIQLAHLDLSDNESLQKLPSEIGNMVNLTNLDLSQNSSLEELPREIGNLIHLKHLNLSFNNSLEELPESICGLHNLQTLDVEYCESLRGLPEGVAHLTGLRTLTEFKGGSGWSKLGLLKKLDHLGGTLRLKIRLDSDDDPEEVIKDVREAELTNKMHIKTLVIDFEDEMDRNESSSSRLRMDVMDALEPHPNLEELEIWSYEGSNLSLGVMVSPLTQLRKVSLVICNHLISVPPLGKLPFLEEISIKMIRGLEIVGREFLGISSSETMIAYPKLKRLELMHCGMWNKWEDITTEEEESSAFQVMPCLTNLEVRYCIGLRALPHRLLRKLSSLETLDVAGSTELLQRYQNRDGSDWKSISTNNPSLQLICD